MIDFPSEIASQAAAHGVDMTALEHLLVTHSHGDHWFPYLLRWRARPATIHEPGQAPPVKVGGPRFTLLPMLHVYGNATVETVLRLELGDRLEALDVRFHPVRASYRFVAGELSVTALPANHDVGREDAYHYVLRSGGKTVLYGLDGDTFLPVTRAALRALQLDVVILESTYGLGNGRNHRNFARVIEEADWLRRENLMSAGGRIVATHFSPHHCPPHRETAEYLAGHGIEAAFDGMQIDL